MSTLPPPGRDPRSAHTHRLDRAAAERLLRRAVPVPDAGTERLVVVLAAASAPGRARELGGEGAALLAFRQVGPGAAATAAPPAGAGAARASRLVVKLVAVVAGIVVATGGIALAAGTGAIPLPLGDDPGGDTPVVSDSRGASEEATAQPPGVSPSPHASAVPTAELAGLCRAYQAAADNPGKAGDTPAFAKLVVAAGEEEVADFCQALLDELDRGSDGSDGVTVDTPVDAGVSTGVPGTAPRGPAPNGAPATPGPAAGRLTDHPTGTSRSWSTTAPGAPTLRSGP